jgi:diacylglycerol kinase family enzyme
LKVLLINTSAGSVDDAALDEITRLAALESVEVVPCRSGDELKRRAQEAVNSNASVVVAAGGDGTINTIAATLADTHVTLAVLPVGTLNHFARDLGVPLDVGEAMHLLTTGEVTTVDVGEVNGRVFINNSGLGLYPYMVHHRKVRERNGTSKWVAAFIASVRALARYRLLRLRVFVNGEQLRRRTPAVFVGNNTYRLDLGVEPKRTSLRDGMLCLYIPHAQRRLQLILFSLRALFRTPRGDADLDMLLTDRFTIDSRHGHLRVSIDGEVEVMTTPLEYRIRPLALRVLVPSRPA